MKCFAGLHSFGEIVDKRTDLNQVGALVRSIWEMVPEHHPNVRLDGFVVMPNHIHMIVRLGRSDDRLGSRADRRKHFGKPVPGSVSTIIRSFKSEATRQVRLMIDKHVALWQPRFDDRSLAGLEAVGRARRYVEDNPARWRINPPPRTTLGLELVDVGGGCELAVPDDDDANQ